MFCRLFPFLCAGVLLFTSPVSADLPGNLSEADLRILQSLSLAGLGPVPASPSNRVADDERAVTMGKALFFDTTLSIDGSLSCASCHQAEMAFTDGKSLAEGMATTTRNTPTLYGAAYLDWLYWDGRRDSLWSQALVPFEDANEMGTSRVAVVQRVLTDPDYQKDYRALFGPPPELDWNSIPDQATPIGVTARQNAWYRLPRQTQQQINRVFANIGKTLEAYQRTLHPPETRFDRFVEVLSRGQTERAGKLVSAAELRGMKLYTDTERTQCLQCHNGPLLSNGGFHNIGSGRFSGQSTDSGRIFGLQAVLMDEFNCLGDYSDAAPGQCDALNHVSQEAHQTLRGAFKTPTLRYLVRTGPYFHDGRFETLAEVVNYYQNPPENGPNGHHELRPMNLTDQQKQALIAFLGMLD